MKSLPFFPSWTPFVVNTKDAVLQDYDTVTIGGKFFSSNKGHLGKLFSTIGFPYRFVKDFFSISSEHAKDFFSSVLNKKYNIIFVNNSDMSFISLSDPKVLKNYYHVLDNLRELTFDSMFCFKEDNFVSRDEYVFVKGDKLLAVSINLVEEKISIFHGQICYNRVYLLFDYDLELYFPDFESFFILADFDKIEVVSFFSEVADVNISLSELVDFLRNTNVLKGRKHMKVINDDFFFTHFDNDFLDMIQKANTCFPFAITPTPYVVNDVLSFSHELLFNSEKVSIQDVYGIHGLILGRELQVYNNGVNYL